MTKFNESESAVLKSFSEDLEVGSDQEVTDKNILEVSLRVVLEIMHVIQAVQHGAREIEIKQKPDGTPVTNIDLECEQLARDIFESALPDFGFYGEEFQETPSRNGYRVILDPVDGTHALIAGESEVGVNLAIQKNQELILAIVANPATGEIGYAMNDEQTRLIQLGKLRNPDSVVELPNYLDESGKPPRILTRSFGKGSAFDETVSLMCKNDLAQHLKSPSGSAALYFLEGAKGSYTVARDWTHEGKLHDFTGLKLIQNAGGHVLTLDGRELPLEGHEGPFFAGVNLNHVEGLRTYFENKIFVT